MKTTATAVDRRRLGTTGMEITAALRRTGAGSGPVPRVGRAPA